MDARADSSALLASLTSPSLGSSVDARAENRRLVQEALAMDSSGSETGTPPPVVRHAVVEQKPSPLAWKRAEGSAKTLLEAERKKKADAQARAESLAAGTIPDASERERLLSLEFEKALRAEREEIVRLRGELAAAEARADGAALVRRTKFPPAPPPDFGDVRRWACALRDAHVALRSEVQNALGVMTIELASAHDTVGPLGFHVAQREAQRVKSALAARDQALADLRRVDGELRGARDAAARQAAEAALAANKLKAEISAAESKTRDARAEIARLKKALEQAGLAGARHASELQREQDARAAAEAAERKARADAAALEKRLHATWGRTVSAAEAAATAAGERAAVAEAEAARLAAERDAAVAELEAMKQKPEPGPTAPAVERRALQKLAAAGRELYVSGGGGDELDAFLTALAAVEAAAPAKLTAAPQAARMTGGSVRRPLQPPLSGVAPPTQQGWRGRRVAPPLT